MPATNGRLELTHLPTPQLVAAQLQHNGRLVGLRILCNTFVWNLTTNMVYMLSDVHGNRIYSHSGSSRQHAKPFYIQTIGQFIANFHPDYGSSAFSYPTFKNLMTRREGGVLRGEMGVSKADKRTCCACESCVS